MNKSIKCPVCKQEYSVDESLVGEEVECAACHHVFIAENQKQDNAENAFLNLSEPWRRWAARFIDLSFEAFCCAFILNICLYIVFFICNLSSHTVEIISEIASPLINYIFAPAFAFLLDNLMYALLDSTIGKWLFGIEVIEKSGEKIKSSRYSIRNYNVLLIGCGLCIPIVSFFTMLIQFFLVSKGKPTSYDKRLGFISTKKNCSFIKTFSGIVFVVLFFVLRGVGIFLTW